MAMTVMKALIWYGGGGGAVKRGRRLPYMADGGNAKQQRPSPVGNAMLTEMATAEVRGGRAGNKRQGQRKQGCRATVAGRALKW